MIIWSPGFTTCEGWSSNLNGNSAQLIVQPGISMMQQKKEIISLWFPVQYCKCEVYIQVMNHSLINSFPDDMVIWLGVIPPVTAIFRYPQLTKTKDRSATNLWAWCKIPWLTWRHTIFHMCQHWLYQELFKVLDPHRNTRWCHQIMFVGFKPTGYGSTFGTHQPPWFMRKCPIQKCELERGQTTFLRVITVINSNPQFCFLYHLPFSKLT